MRRKWLPVLEYYFTKKLSIDYQKVLRLNIIITPFAQPSFELWTSQSIGLKSANSRKQSIFRFYINGGVTFSYHMSADGNKLFIKTIIWSKAIKSNCTIQSWSSQYMFYNTNISICVFTKYCTCIFKISTFPVWFR